MGNLNILQTTINIGLKKSVKLLQITDSHICRGYDCGFNRKSKFDTEDNCFTEDYYFEALKYAKERNITVLHTGDLIDYLSPENLDFIEKHFNGIDYIYATGNHDFFDYRDYNTVYDENIEFRDNHINRIAPYIKNNVLFYSRIIDGVNIVTMDDSYYRITKGQLDMLKAEAAKGYPIVLGMHVPIYSPGLAKASIPDWAPNVSFVLGAPEEILIRYPVERRIQQEADAETAKAIEYIKSEPIIKALIAGHTHINYEEEISDGKMQYTTHGSFAGYAREITIC